MHTMYMARYILYIKRAIYRNYHTCMSKDCMQQMQQSLYSHQDQAIIDALDCGVVDYNHIELSSNMSKISLDGFQGLEFPMAELDLIVTNVQQAEKIVT